VGCAIAFVEETAMKKYSLKSINVLLTFVVGVGVAMIQTTDGWAQQKCKQSGKNLAQDSKYVQQHMIDTGDIPGHQVRIMEIHRTPSNAMPNCEGLKIVESWNRGYSDYVNGNGRAWGYRVYILENGDKIFAHYSGNSHTTLNADGSKKGTYTGVYVITGGTGRYRGVQGTGREFSNFNIQTGFNEAEWEEEYWIEN
jgi:hypothetical protein